MLLDIPEAMTPQRQGLLSTGLGLLSQSGPSRMPVGLGQALGVAGQAGMDRAALAEREQINRSIQMETLKSQDAIRQAQAAQLAEVVEEKKRRALLTQELSAEVAKGGSMEEIQYRTLPIYMRYDAAKGQELMNNIIQENSKREQRLQELQMRLEDRMLDRESKERIERQSNDIRLQIAQGQQALTRAIAESRREQPRPTMLQTDQGSMWVTPPTDMSPGQQRPIVGPNNEPLRPAAAATTKLPAEIQRMNVAMNSLDEGLKEYRKLLEEFNPRNPADQGNATKRARAASLVADLRMQAKEAQALGALTGPDMMILDQLLRDPTGLMGAYYGREGLLKQADEAEKAIARRREGIAKQFPGAPGTGAPAAQKPWEKDR